jgi:hypothetical protein
LIRKSALGRVRLIGKINFFYSLFYLPDLKIGSHV